MIKYASKDIYKFFTEKNGKLVDKTTFSSILKAYNKAFMELVITEGVKLSIGGTTGHIQVVKKERRLRGGKLAMQADFPSSLKIKREIIARGGIPLENYKDDEGNIIGNNGGEPWLVYYTDPYKLKIKWIRHRLAHKSLRLFKFTAGKLPKREMLPEFKNKFPEKAKLIYQYDYNKADKQ